ncbi:MAG: hypothetical protein K9H25_13535 [Rhodospirillum sp.]|nr:hypothetical protein [Rhodospirillum sp.]MCF8487783.1 hypothetical protein [Rhodospirillum sp.]
MRKLHPLAGVIALGLALLFWTSTLLVEVLGSISQIAWVKTTIPWVLPGMVLALIIAAASGRKLGSRVPSTTSAAAVLGAKAKRMPFLAGNGLLILIPSALFLAWKAEGGAFDEAFVAVQILELVAGAANITLMALNARDGRRLANLT